EMRAAVGLRPGVPASPGGGVPNVTSFVRVLIPLANRSHTTLEGVLDYAYGRLLAEKGAAAPGVESQGFKSFLDPVAGTDANGGLVQAFIATVSGVPSGSDKGVGATTRARLRLMRLA